MRPRHAQPDDSQKLEAICRKPAGLVPRNPAPHLLYDLQGEPPGYGRRNHPVRREVAPCELCAPRQAARGRRARRHPDGERLSSGGVVRGHGEGKPVASRRGFLPGTRKARGRCRKPVRDYLLQGLRFIAREQNNPVGGSVRPAYLLLGGGLVRVRGVGKQWMRSGHPRLRCQLMQRFDEDRLKAILLRGFRRKSYRRERCRYSAPKLAATRHWLRIMFRWWGIILVDQGESERSADRDIPWT